MEQNYFIGLKKLLVLVIFLFSLFSFQALVTNKLTLGPTNKVIVSRVIDGDTIELSTGERVRYIGVDSPEIDYKGGDNDCYALKVKKINIQLVEGKEIIMEKDISNRDRYNRLLRYVYVKNKQGKEIFINKYLVKNGYAQIATYPPDVKYVEQFKQAQTWARENQKGLWLACY